MLGLSYSVPGRVLEMASPSGSAVRDLQRKLWGRRGADWRRAVDSRTGWAGAGRRHLRHDAVSDPELAGGASTRERPDRPVGALAWTMVRQPAPAGVRL